MKLIEDTPSTAALYLRSTPDGIKRFESSRFKELPRTKPKEPNSAPPGDRLTISRAQSVDGGGGARRAGGTLPQAAAAALGFDEARLRRIDGAVDRAVAAGLIPGAVVLVGRRGAIAYVHVAGRRAVEPVSEPMTRDTVFDMASLTKPVVTATAVMLLIDEGRLRLEDHVVRFLPELDNHGKNRITVEHLLRHRAGLAADNPLEDYVGGPAEAWNRIAGMELSAVPGERFVYSDVGFMILGRLVERVCGQSLDQFARDRIFRVIGMADAHFRPLNERAGEERLPVDRIAPTERSTPSGAILRGVVHDPRARALGGVAGHAGLFATADDLAVFAEALVGGGASALGRRLLSPLAVRALIDPGATPAGQRRGLGWDIATSFSSPRGELFGPESFGHTGFTGTSLWIDPETETFVILLTSRLHPDGKQPAPTNLRREIATLAAAAIVDAPVRRTARLEPVPPAVPATTRERPGVLCGIDVLVENRFAPLCGKRVGLITNHTGRTRDGRTTIDVLYHAPGVKLVRLFSPEHGIRGDFDSAVTDDRDQATGLPIVSLYGAKKKPTPVDLDDLDVLVFDIQDVGVRYYTYITTLELVLEAAAESGKSMLVLDRPNPIGGRLVAGPLRDADLASFIAYHAAPRPSRHDRGRAGPAVQRRTQARSPSRCRRLSRMVPGRDLRSNRPGLDQSVAEHEKPDRGHALSRRGLAGIDERRDRPGNGCSVRTRRRALD